jgi:hypothetical protein
MNWLSPPLSPAKAAAQIQPEHLVGFIWIPAFAGTSGFEVTQ